MQLHLHHRSLSSIYKHQPPQLNFTTNKKPIPIINISLWPHVFKKSNVNQPPFSSSYQYPVVFVHAVQKDSEYEINPDKAKEALQKLDQQLQALSKKELAPPKIKAYDVKITRDQTTEEVPEIPGSVLAYWAIALFLFSIFYNTLFYTVIKPSIDRAGEPTATTTYNNVERESPGMTVLQFLPFMPEVVMQCGDGGGH